MARPGLIAVGVGAALVAGAAYAVLAEGPQSSIPLAVEEPPAIVAVPAEPGPEPESELSGPAQMPEPVAPQLLRHGPRDVPKVAITFDTAFSAETAALTAAGVFPPQFNEPVLDYLDAESVPATMFVTGVWAEAYPQAMERIAATDRFELANHTWSHAGWTDDCYGLPSPGDEVASRFEIARSAKLISEYTGQWPSYIRFPGLCVDLYDVALAAEYGSRTVDVDVTIFDSGMTDPTSTAMGIMSQVQPGSIILLHLNGPPNAPVTLDILKQVLPALRERGLTPVTVSELLAPVESGEPTG